MLLKLGKTKEAEELFSKIVRTYLNNLKLNKKNRHKPEYIPIPIS